MLNTVILIGKVKKDLELRESSNGRSFSILTLEVENPESGKGEKELIDVSLWGYTAENVSKYAGEGSSISVRGRATNRILDFPDHQVRTIETVGEQVSFIQTKVPGSFKTNNPKTANDLSTSLNQTILIGRTTRDIELKESESGRTYANVTLAVTRSFKNVETNSYEVDFIDVTLWDQKAREVAKYAGKGSAISVRGHLTDRNLELPFGHMRTRTIGVVGDKVSYVSLKSPQLEQQISKSSKEVEQIDEWIPMSEFEKNPDRYPEIMNRSNQNEVNEIEIE